MAWGGGVCRGLCVFRYRRSSLMQSSFRETADFLKALSTDVEYCYDKLESEDSQFWRRTFIRAMFAFAEGFIFRMKQSAIDIHNLEGNLFDEAELVFLKEEDTREFILNRKGETEIQSKKRL